MQPCWNPFPMQNDSISPDVLLTATATISWPCFIFYSKPEFSSTIYSKLNWPVIMVLFVSQILKNDLDSLSGDC